jgi:tripartite-type tricarboxylate transporter receptor subunit TctC
MERRQFIAGLGGAAAQAVAAPVFSSVASAQAYPSRLVRFIVPFPAGGATDVAARIVGQDLSHTFGRQIVIDNRAGAGGIIGLEAAARSETDGYTALVMSDYVASVVHVFKLNIEPAQALEPVVQLSRQPVVLAVHPSLGVDSLAALITLAKRQPGLNYLVGGGIGAQQHVVVEWFARIAGIKLAVVTYRGGGPAINDLVAGHVKIGSLGSTPLIPYYKAGTLRLLAQSTADRSPSLPEVPTFKESGIGELVIDQWTGVFVPTGTPRSIIATLNAGINKALANPTIREKFLTQAQEPVGGTSNQFSQLFRDDYAKYQRLINDLGIKGA